MNGPWKLFEYASEPAMMMSAAAIRVKELRKLLRGDSEPLRPLDRDRTWLIL